MNKELEELIAIVGKKEDLHPDLVDYVYTGEVMDMIQHPLLHTMYARGFESTLNKTYKAKLAALAECKRTGRWDFIIEVLYDKPHRLDALLAHGHELDDDAQYWRTVSSVWTIMEYFHDSLPQWGEIFNSERSGRENMMDDSEQKELLALPRMIEIYRGGNPEGWSWTLDRTIAMWFANRFEKGWPIHTRKIPKDHVIALLNGRNEKEIIWRQQ